MVYPANGRVVKGAAVARPQEELNKREANSKTVVGVAPGFMCLEALDGGFNCSAKWQGALLRCYLLSNCKVVWLATCCILRDLRPLGIIGRCLKFSPLEPSFSGQPLA